MINISRNIYISFMWVGVFFLLGRGFSSRETCGSPARLCKTRYNTTAPMYGVSLTSGQPVTIVQKFPDLLQQVVFEVCEWVFTLSYLWAWSFKIRSIACKLKNEVRFITFVARSIVICEYMRRVSNWNSSRPTGKYINSNLAQWAGQLWPGQSLLFENVLDQYFRAFIYDTCRRSRRSSGKELSILTPFFPSSSSILNISFLLNNNAAVQKR